ncbi:unnamed protein product [Amaranthus hypochondriacus]
MEMASPCRTPSNSRNNLKHSSSSSSKWSRIWASIKGKSCAICLNQISGHRPAVINHCLHAYCLACLLRWSNYKRTCPLCNSHFDSYFSPSSISSSSFHLHHLPPLSSPPSPDHSRPRHTRAVDIFRARWRRREHNDAVNSRSRPVPRLRSFRGGESVPSEVITERILQWRASIYKRGFLAVPFSSRNLQSPNLSLSKERILQRIEPWIRRELQAILQDPDPTIIVHVATSLYLSRFHMTGDLSTAMDNIDGFLDPLRRFLGEWTDMFWHELRCFAESTFSMVTYDEVVKYRRVNNS